MRFAVQPRSPQVTTLAPYAQAQAKAFLGAKLAAAQKENAPDAKVPGTMGDLGILQGPQNYRKRLDRPEHHPRKLHETD